MSKQGKNNFVSLGEAFKLISEQTAAQARGKMEALGTLKKCPD